MKTDDEHNIMIPSQHIDIVKEEMDGWIRQLRQELRAVSDQSDDIEDEVSKQTEELRFNYETLSSLQLKMERLETAVEEIRSMLMTQGGSCCSHSALSPLQTKQG